MTSLWKAGRWPVMAFATLMGLGLAGQSAQAATGTCTGVWPSYWQDPAFDKTTMWLDQRKSDTPASQHWKRGNPEYTNPPFELSDAYATGHPDNPKTQPWRDKKFDPMFDAKTAQAEKRKLAEAYAWDVMHYIQAGNIGTGNVNTDWNMCNNKIRPWFNMPFQTYDVLSGREFIHGLTREAPVTYSVKPLPGSKDMTLNATVWAIGFYNGNAAPTLAKVWHANGSATVPKANLLFDEGTVIGKLLFITATPAQLPFLTNMPQWTANISTGATTNKSNPTFCEPPKGASMPDQSKDCPRKPGKVRLLQFDIAIRDDRAPIGWVYGTFVADGLHKARVTNPWDRISLLGLMWGNDTPPYGTLASEFPINPTVNGFKDGVIAWDVAARLNQAGGPDASARPGHLGCDKRLNGPADNVSSSCLSCHMTASVSDAENRTPPILAQFGTNTNGNRLTPQCHVKADTKDKEYDGVTFAQMDSIYFADTRCGTAFNTLLPAKHGEPQVCVLGTNIPHYADGNRQWVSTDFSLQLSDAIVEWKEWQIHRAAYEKEEAIARKHGIKANAVMLRPRIFKAEIPERGDEVH